MKIVFISSAYYPSIGGVETHVQSVARELVRRGHKVLVVTENQQSKAGSDNKATNSKSNVKSTLFTRERLDQIDIYYFKFGHPSFIKKFRIWIYLFQNRHLFLDADVIHIHDVFIWYLPLRFYFWNKKVFTTFHGYETVFPPEEIAKFIRKISEKLSYGNIIIGEFIKKWYGTRPDIIMYGGVDKVTLRSYKTINKRRRVLKILFIGRLEKDIGILIYRDALRILRDKGVDFELVIHGEGSLRAEIESYGKVEGFVKDLRSSIKKSDIVFSSSYLTMLQVMQLGRPIFAAYNNPLKHDYLRTSPFAEYITVSGSAYELARQLTRFQPNIKKLEKGQKWAQKQTWEKVTDMYLQLWDKK